MENLIYGMLLGDSAIYLDGKTPILAINHCEAQKEYVIWKAKMLGFKGAIRQTTSGYGYKMHVFHYYNAPLLKPIYQTCIIDKKKIVTEKWIDKLDSLSLAVWFQDDGSWSISGKRTKNGSRGQRTSQFATHGFDFKSVYLLCEWLCSKGYSAKVKETKKCQMFIHLNHTSTVKLWHEIAPYIILKYKIDNNVGNVDYCKCGKTKIYSQSNCDECLFNIGILPRKGDLKRNDTDKKLQKRFGTSSIVSLKKNHPVFNFPSVYRMNPDIIGSAVSGDDYVSISQNMDRIH